MSHSVVLLVLVPLISAFLASLLPEGPRSSVRITVALSAVAHLILVIRLTLQTAAVGSITYEVGGWSAPLGIVLSADLLSSFFLIILAAGHILFLIHAFSEERKSRRAVWILTELLIAAFSGILVAGDLFNLFVFLELASVSSVGLMTYKQRAEGAGAGFVYLIFTSLSGVLFLLAVIIIYRHVGALSLGIIAARGAATPPRSYRTAAALLTASLGMKFGLVPFHFWQAPAYDAAGSSVAALLSGTGMKVYLYVLFRLLAQVFRAHETPAALALLLVALGSVNILIGHALALGERDLKRLLAYSSVAHVGYILIALAGVLAAPSAEVGLIAASGALLHVLFHFLMKSTLFYSGRTLIDRRGSSTIGALRGVGRREVLGFIAFVTAAISLVGIPPMSGFYSKWRIALGSIRIFGVPPVVVIAAGTVISMLYYARVFHVGMGEASGALRDRSGKAAGAGGPEGMRAGTGNDRSGATVRTRTMVLLLAAACLIFGLFGPLVESRLEEVSQLLADPNRYELLLLR
ncbi:MAG: complex I subunit 5 family protein [Alkalispirochaetaceae bacterium]